MTEDDRRPEPNRPPDLWLPPTTTGLSSASPTWRQPPGWREPVPWQQPPAAPVAPPRVPGPRRASGPPWAAVHRRPPAPNVTSLVLRLSLLFLPVAFLVGLSTALGASSDRTPAPPYDPAPAPGTIPEVWGLTAAQLRPDLPQPAFESSMDGSFTTKYLAQVGRTWLAMSGTAEDGNLTLHGIDPDTGAVRWQRPLDGALCTTETPRTGLVLCASVLERDQATGLGTRWQLHLLDPTTGADKTTRDVDGWFTAVHWTGRSFVALEQREPAPHAVVRAFDAADLRDLWTRDLAGEPGQDEMFSEDKIIVRTDPRPGIALDRPRFRDVGKGLVALWAGQRTAFIDASDGRLVLMPHCSRLVDDGRRLWCNEVDGASAYGYDGRPLVRVRGPRLAFPDDDEVGNDRSRAVFLDDDGRAVSVDPTTGAVGAPYTPPGRGSAFGNATEPSVEAVGERTFLVGGAGAMLLDPDHDRTEWLNPSITLSDVPVLLGEDRVLLGAGRVTAVDLTTGGSRAELRADATYVVGVGDRVAGVGQERLSLLAP